MTMESEDRQAIRDVIEGWAIWRDSGDWDNLRTCWHDGAIINATWFQGDSEQFIANAAKAFAKGGPGSVHFLGGTAIALRGSRAIAQTKMMISSRDDVEGAVCDIVCTGRFYDFFEKRDGRWAIVERQPIYEKDRLDPLDPAKMPRFDPEVYDSIPEGYRHLGYIQVKRGLPVKRNMPGLRGPEVEALYARGKAWLAN
jgi:SnoaL-like domain